jgi:hypothetical protein
MQGRNSQVDWQAVIEGMTGREGARRREGASERGRDRARDRSERGRTLFEAKEQEQHKGEAERKPGTRRGVCVWEVPESADRAR